MTPKIIVIGAGVVGLCAALRFQERGWTVQIVDRQDIGKGASFGNAGFIASEAVDPLATPDNIRKAPKMLFDKNGALALPIKNGVQIVPWLWQFMGASQAERVAEIRATLSALLVEAAPAWRRLLNKIDRASHLVDTFYLRVWESENTDAALAERDFYRRWGIAAEFADKNEVLRLQPELSTIHHAVVLPHAHRVRDPYQLVLELAEIFKQRGGEILHDDVQRIENTSDGVKLIAKKEIFHAQKAILCGGAFSSALLESFGWKIPLMAERGYHLTLDGQQNLLAAPICSAERNVFLNPLECGLRISGFSELGGTELPEFPQRYDVLRHHLQALFPQSSVANATEWFGMRPTLPDSLPVIDVCPNAPNLALVFGHQHLGLTLAARSAELIVAKVLEEHTPHELNACQLARFSAKAEVQHG